MKYLSADWGAVLEALPAWDALPVEARRVVLKEMKPSAGSSVRDLGEWAEAVRGSGLVDGSAAGKRLQPRPAVRPLLLVFRALDRQRIWDVPKPGVLADYLREHFTSEEAAALLLGPGIRAGYADWRALAERASAEEWTEAFLAAGTREAAVQWERGRLPSGEGPRFELPGVWEAARRMVRALLELPAPVPLRELPRRFPDVEPATLSAALEASLRTLLLFAGIRDADLEPAVGPWPEVAARLGAAPPGAPAPLAVADAFEAAWMMEDLTTVLVAASAEPIRLRAADGAVFARTCTAIAARLIPLPAWVVNLVGPGPEDRVDSAAVLLSELKWVRVARSGAGVSLEVTREGAAWLALSDHERLAAFLDPLRASPQRNPAYVYASGARAFDFFPVTLPGPVRDSRLDLRGALSRAFLSLPEGFVPLAAFLEHARRAVNPLAESADAGRKPIELYWGGRALQRRDWERMWGEILASFFVARLTALGGARLGRTEDGEVCFALTGVGRYLLGAADSFEYGHAGGAEVVVQPNFEVVFLAPAPRVEAQLARFAERVGAGVGVLFRLTRASVLAAAEAGMTEAQMVEALRGASSRELPANVARQLRDWLSAVRRVRMRPAVLLECPDKETAGRVRAAAGKHARQITPTLLEIPELPAKERMAMVKKLRSSGVFVQ